MKCLVSLLRILKILETPFALVRSNFEFGSLIWTCNYTIYSKNLDNVQYKFLKRVSYLSKISLFRDCINSVQNYLSLDSLSIRRNLANVMLINDAINR